MHCRTFNRLSGPRIIYLLLIEPLHLGHCFTKFSLIEFKTNWIFFSSLSKLLAFSIIFFAETTPIPLIHAKSLGLEFAISSIVLTPALSKLIAATHPD